MTDISHDTPLADLTVGQLLALLGRSPAPGAAFYDYDNPSREWLDEHGSFDGDGSGGPGQKWWPKYCDSVEAKTFYQRWVNAVQNGALALADVKNPFPGELERSPEAVADPEQFRREVNASALNWDTDKTGF